MGMQAAHAGRVAIVVSVVVQPLGELDIGPKRIGKERDCDAQRFDLTIRSIKGHTHRLEALAKRFEPVDLESNVVKTSALGSLQRFG